MQEILVVVEVPEQKKVKIGTFYLEHGVDIWCSTTMDKLQGPESTYVQLLEEFKANFSSITI